MNKLRSARKVTVLTLAVLAIVLLVIAPGPARARDGGHVGGHPGAFAGHPGVRHGFVGHPGFHHGFVRPGPFRFGVAPLYPYYDYYPPVAGYAAPAYWYYCQSYRAYYPNVGSCPEAWVPVPAR